MPGHELKLGFLLREKWLALVFGHAGIRGTIQKVPTASDTIHCLLKRSMYSVDVGFLPVVVLTCSFSQANRVDGGPPGPKTHVV
jgi:hypothetical protein